ncbi:MAG: hypothetical protein C4307_01425 [Chloroflexota bacterium]
MARRAVAPLALVLAFLTALVAGAGAPKASAPPWRATHLSAAPAASGGGARTALRWCGSGQPPSLDRQPSVDISSPDQVHAVYVVAADGVDRYSSFAGLIATDAAAIDAWWRRQDPTRAPRFDRYPFPGCTTPFADLDVGFLRLPRSGAQYVGDGGERLLSDLGQLERLSTFKLLVYYDGPPVFDPGVCGTAFLPSPGVARRGGAFGLAFVWTQSRCASDVGAGRLAAAVAAHELIHVLGALSEPGAPNECPAPDGGHVCDSPNDILFPTASPDTTLDGQLLDVGRDDYYGHEGGWLDVQDSPWLARLPQLALILRAPGRGGTVQIVTPTAATCSSSCAFLLDPGTRVTAVATPAPGSRFLGWEAPCGLEPSCTVVPQADTVLAARFGPALFRITVSIVGRGKVVSVPRLLSCTGRCSAPFPAEGTVRLRATPAPGFRFVGWSGACRGGRSCAIALDRDRAVKARFARR